MNEDTNWTVTARVLSCKDGNNGTADVRLVGHEAENVLELLVRETQAPFTKQHIKSTDGDLMAFTFEDLNDAFWFRLRYDQAVASHVVN